MKELIKQTISRIKTLQAELELTKKEKHSFPSDSLSNYYDIQIAKLEGAIEELIGQKIMLEKFKKTITYGNQRNDRQD